MKLAHSRETLRAIDRFPFEDEVLERLVSTQERGGRIYLTYQCICRYMEMFAETYHFPTECDVEKILLLQKMLLDGNYAVTFFEDSEYNANSWLFNLGAYCDWDCMCFSEQDLQDAGLSLEADEPLEKQIDKAECFTDFSKLCLKKFTANVEETLMDECGFLYVLRINGVQEYRKYKEQHPEEIGNRFLREDRIIGSILENAKDVLINDNVTDYFEHDTEGVLLSWKTGSDGYYYTSIGSLSPNWLISMYVLHGLLEHAQVLFGYEIGGK